MVAAIARWLHLAIGIAVELDIKVVTVEVAVEQGAIDVLATATL